MPVQGEAEQGKRVRGTFQRLIWAPGPRLSVPCSAPQACPGPRTYSGGACPSSARNTASRCRCRLIRHSSRQTRLPSRSLPAVRQGLCLALPVAPDQAQQPSPTCLQGTSSRAPARRLPRTMPSDLWLQI